MTANIMIYTALIIAVLLSHVKKEVRITHNVETHSATMEEPIQPQAKPRYRTKKPKHKRFKAWTGKDRSRQDFTSGRSINRGK